MSAPMRSDQTDVLPYVAASRGPNYRAPEVLPQVRKVPTDAALNNFVLVAPGEELTGWYCASVPITVALSRNYGQQVNIPCFQGQDFDTGGGECPAVIRAGMYLSTVGVQAGGFVFFELYFLPSSGVMEAAQ